MATGPGTRGCALEGDGTRLTLTSERHAIHLDLRTGDVLGRPKRTAAPTPRRSHQRDGLGAVHAIGGDLVVQPASGERQTIATGHGEIVDLGVASEPYPGDVLHVWTPSASTAWSTDAALASAAWAPADRAKAAPAAWTPEAPLRWPRPLSQRPATDLDQAPRVTAVEPPPPDDDDRSPEVMLLERALLLADAGDDRAAVDAVRSAVDRAASGPADILHAIIQTGVELATALHDEAVLAELEQRQAAHLPPMPALEPHASDDLTAWH